MAAEAGEDAPERQVRPGRVGGFGLVGQEALVGDAGLAHAAGRFVEARRFQRLLRLLVQLARPLELAQPLAQRRRLRPHAPALVDVGGALLLGDGGVMQRLAQAGRFGEVAPVEQQAQQLGLVAALTRDVGGVSPVPDALVELLRAAEIAVPARLGGGLAVLAERDQGLDVHPRGNMIRKPAPE